MACGVQFLEDRGSCGEKEDRGATTLPRERRGVTSSREMDREDPPSCPSSVLHVPAEQLRSFL